MAVTSSNLAKQDRQYVHNVTLRRIRATTVLVQNQQYYIFWVCVCSLRFPACKAHAPYYCIFSSAPCLDAEYFSTLSH